MTDYPIHIDPFERRHIGEHGAFTLRTNIEHVRRCIAVLKPEMGKVYDHPVSEVVSIKRRAA